MYENVSGDKKNVYKLFKKICLHAKWMNLQGNILRDFFTVFWILLLYFVTFPNNTIWTLNLDQRLSSQLTFSCRKSTTETLEKWCEICSKLTIKTPERRH